MKCWGQVFNRKICKDVLIIFRGSYTRVQDPIFVCKNIQSKVLRALAEKDLKYDVFFSTYNDDFEKLTVYKKALSPKRIYFSQNGQVINFKETLEFIDPFVKSYKFIVFLRFEAIYKLPITEWNFFDKSGLILPFKEDTGALFDKTGWYNDSIIILSSDIFFNFKNSLFACAKEMFQPENTLHNLANIVLKYDKTIPVSCLFDGYFQSNHSHYPQSDDHLSPLYILVHYPYNGSDKNKFYF